MDSWTSKPAGGECLQLLAIETWSMTDFGCGHDAPSAAQPNRYRRLIKRASGQEPRGIMALAQEEKATRSLDAIKGSLTYAAHW